MFNKNEMQKTDQTEFKIEKIVKTKKKAIIFT